MIVCDPDIVIFSVKDIPIKTQEPDEIARKRWNNKAIESSVKQIYGAERILKTLKFVTKADGTNGLQLPSPDSIRIHRIAIALGGKRKSYVRSGDFGKGHIHIFDDDSFRIILEELNTISDFIDYLNAKTNLVSAARQTVLEGGEEDLLAFYLSNDRKFPQPTGFMIIGDNIWEDFYNSEPYKAKRKADEISYVWDKLIETVAGFALKDELLFGPNISETEFALRFLARETRLNRRSLGNALIDFLSSTKHIDSRLMLGESGIIYVFLAKLIGATRELRKTELEIRSFIAKDLFPKLPTVIGLATEIPNDSGRSTWDLMCIHKEAWTEEDHKSAILAKEKTGYFANQRIGKWEIDEYPSTTQESGVSNE